MLCVGYHVVCMGVPHAHALYMCVASTVMSLFNFSIYGSVHYVYAVCVASVSQLIGHIENGSADWPY